MAWIFTAGDVETSSLICTDFGYHTAPEDYMKKIEKETQENIKQLVQIRDDVSTSPAVKIQAIQTLQKILDNMGASAGDDQPSAKDIMSKIRGTKK